jgi:hypothetical protein
MGDKARKVSSKRSRTAGLIAVLVHLRDLGEEGTE